MQKTKDNIKLRNDEVQEILSHVPTWMVRWGTTLLFMLVLSALFLAWLIKYPDVIPGEVIITTSSPTIKVVTKNAGELGQLMFDDQQTVRQGQVIATIQSALDANGKEYLETLAQDLRAVLDDDDFEFRLDDHNMIFGVVHDSYTSLDAAVSKYMFFLSNNTQTFDIENTGSQISNHKGLKRENQGQLKLTEEQLVWTSEKFDSDQLLYAQELISKLDFYEANKALNKAHTDIGDLRKLILQNSISITELEKELVRLQSEYKKERNDYIRTIDIHLNTIESAVQNWERGFELKAPIDGKLSYLNHLAEHQFIEIETPLFAIVPQDQHFVGYLMVSQIGVGKVAIGQRVMVKLDNYPSHEYGRLIGIVSAISQLPEEKRYRVEFELINGMTSDYHKVLEYMPEMGGAAEVITDDLRLLQRIFSQFRAVFD
jgi:multidrug resistance efflux pump